MTGRTHTRWGLVVLLWLAGLGAAAQYGKIAVVFDRLPGLYPGGGAALGFAVSLVGFVGIVLGVAAGVIVARAGYRRALLVALGVGAVVSAFQASLPPLPLFLASRVLEGASHLAIVVAAPTLIAQFSAPADRGLALTLWGTFFGVAFAVLAWAGLPLVAAQGVRALLLAHAAYMLAMLVLLRMLLPPLVAGRGPAPFGLADLLHAQWRILTEAAVSTPAIGWFFYTVCYLSLLTVLPQFLAPEHRALVIGALPLVSIFVSLTLGVRLLRYFPAVSVVISGFSAAALVAAGLWALPGNPWLALAMGAAFGLIQGAGFAAVPQLNPTPEDQALANGGLAQTGNLGNTLGTPLMVAVIGVAGYGGMIAVLGLLLAGGALALYLRTPRGMTAG